MKYEKCLTCKQLGETCDGPNLMAMETAELGLWCNELRKKKPGMTYDRIAADTGVSKSAVHSFLNGTHADYRRETFRPIVKYITGGKWDDNPCGNITNTEKAAYEEKIQHLKDEIQWRDDTIQHLTKNNESMETLVANSNARHTADKDFLRKQLEDRYYFLKRKDKVIVMLSVMLALCVTAIIAALIIDRMNGGVGFFWLESLLNRGIGNGSRQLGCLPNWII